MHNDLASRSLAAHFPLLPHKAFISLWTGRVIMFVGKEAVIISHCFPLIA